MRPPLLLISLLAAGCAPSDPTRTNLEFVPEMVDSVPFDTFSPNPVTHDGKTLMLPAKGTIPRGFTPFHYGPGPVEAERAGRELSSPVPESPEVLARGEKVFRTFCTPCHGAAGQGDGPVVPRFPQPPSLTAAHAKAMPDGRIFHVITHGQGLMPSHASQIAADDRWRAIHWVRSLQKGGAK
jgi:mono/diheme cytochrome c family protein